MSKNKPFSGLKPFFFVLLYASDVVTFLLSLFLTSLIIKFNLVDIFFMRIFLFTLLILIVNYSAYGLYKDKRNLFDDNDFMHMLYSGLITFFVLLIFVALFDPAEMILVWIIGLTLVITLFLSSISRMLLHRIVYFFRRAGYDKRRVMFFGDNNDELIEKIKENKSLGYEIVKTTNNIDLLKKYLPMVDIVFMHMKQVDEKLLDMIIQNKRVKWKIVPPILNLVIDPVDFDEFKDYPIINISPSEISSGYRRVKRVMDFLISGIALLILSPLFLVVSLGIRLSMPGPVFFKQERLGKNLKPFMLYKFRTMIIGADAQKNKLEKKNEVKGLFKMKDDPRVTKFGKFLRRTCIDELPQLINIFKGEMSIVGPRPHLRRELDNFKGWRRARFNVKPGLTGLWQVNGRHELNFDKAVLYDIYYTRHMSLLVDFTIIMKTIPALIITKGRF